MTNETAGSTWNDEDQAQALLEGESKPKRSMSDTLRAHRDGYQAAAAYSGKASLHNGDAIAQALQGLTPQQVLTVAQTIADMLKPGAVDLEAKYVGEGGWAKPRLNLGQIRMNAGNRIRGAIKREDITEDEALAMIPTS